MSSNPVTEHARYPFTREAVDYVARRGITLDMILNAPEYAPIRERGVERVREAVSRHIVSDMSQTLGIIELCSYPVARLVVSLLSDRGVVKYYSRAEAARLRLLLERERSPVPAALRVLGELGLEFDLVEGDDGAVVHIPIPAYLRVAPPGRKFKLVNRLLGSGEHAGTVIVTDPSELVRLAESAFRVRIEDDLPLEVSGDVRSLLEPYIAEVSEAIYKSWVRPVEEMGEVVLEAIPPCMQALLGALQKGSDILHQGRFALTSFLSSIGMNSKDIIELFSRAPNFRPDLTRYQVEHISGNISSTKYTPPECGTMQTYAICVNMDDLCRRNWMRHPLIYYRVRRREMGDGSGDGGEDVTPRPAST